MKRNIIVCDTCGRLIGEGHGCPGIIKKGTYTMMLCKDCITELSPSIQAFIESKKDERANRLKVLNEQFKNINEGKE